MAKAIDRGLENREIVLGVLTEVLDKGNFVHLVLNQALSKYQYLEKPDRAFITRVTEGTLEYLLQIDYIINSYSKTKTEKMKPLIRNILRMSVYQLLYMDRVPDSAVCNEAVKLAKRKGFGSLSGFVNGVLRNISRNLSSITYPDGQKDQIQLQPSAVDVFHVGKRLGKGKCRKDCRIFLKGTPCMGAL